MLIATIPTPYVALIDPTTGDLVWALQPTHRRLMDRLGLVYANATSGQAKAGKATAAELRAKRSEFLSLVVQHPTMIDDANAVAQRIGIHAATAYKWINEFKSGNLKLKG